MSSLTPLHVASIFGSSTVAKVGMGISQIYFACLVPLLRTLAPLQPAGFYGLTLSQST